MIKQWIYVVHLLRWLCKTLEGTEKASEMFPFHSTLWIILRLGVYIREILVSLVPFFVRYSQFSQWTYRI
jgi:hypothetical protein